MNALDHALQPLAGLRLARLPRATRLCLEMLDRLDGGAIAVELPDGVRVRAGHGALVAHLRVRDHAVFDEALAHEVDQFDQQGDTRLAQYAEQVRRFDRQRQLRLLQ